jgi:hypothetical protein
VLAAHPVLKDTCNLLLSDKLAALPTFMHYAACQRVVRDAGGTAIVSALEQALLLRTLQAVRSSSAHLREVRLHFRDQFTYQFTYSSVTTGIEQVQLACVAAANPHLAALTSITSLHMQSIRLVAVNASLPALAALPALAHLALGGVHVATDEFSLDEDYKWDGIVYACAQALGAGLKACRSLSSLALDYEHDGIAIMMEQSIAPCLANVTTLKRLQLARLDSDDGVSPQCKQQRSCRRWHPWTWAISTTTCAFQTRWRATRMHSRHCDISHSCTSAHGRRSWPRSRS